MTLNHWTTCAIGVAVVTVLVGQCPATEIAGDGSHLWIVQPHKEDQLIILRRDSGSAQHSLRPAGVRLFGRLVAGGVTSADDRLWLVYEDMTVQSIRVSRLREDEPTVYERRSVERLPKGMAIRSLAARGDELWALVTTADAATEVIDNAIDQLFRLTSQGWHSETLPDDWPHGSIAWMRMRQTRGDAPSLVAIHRDGDPHLAVFHRSEGQWSSARHTWMEPGHIEVAAVEEHLVAGRQVGDEVDLVVELSLIQVTGAPVTFGEIRVEQAADQKWALLPVEGRYPVGVVTWDDKEQLSLAQTNWEGKSPPPATLSLDLTPDWSAAAEHLILIVVLGVTTLIMFVFWKHDPQAHEIVLPAGIAAADLSRRALATAIDLVPGVVVMVVVFDVEPADFAALWSFHGSGDWRYMAPMLAAVSVFVIHSGLTELFTARSMGKAIMGLRVTDLAGKPPHARQVLIRNLLKYFELIPPVLFILPLLTPQRQRLGDLVARTVVVSLASNDRQGGRDDGQ